ncbi:unnamed protein product [Brassica oleracea]
MRYRPKSIIYTVNCKPTLAFGEDKEERQWNLMEMEETMTYCVTGANGYVGSCKISIFSNQVERK